MQVPASAPASIALARLTVAQYHGMRDARILDGDSRVELLEGILVQKVTKHPPHRLVTKLVRDALAAVSPAGCYVDSQEPITTADSEPEPDVVVVRGAPRDYADRHPGPLDVLLVVEVADDSVPSDRATKGRVYARAGIATYWIVNIPARQIEVYTEPGPEGYGARRDFADGAAVPVVIGEATASLAVASVLP